MNLTREFLYQKYIHDKKSLKEIADETGLPTRRGTKHTPVSIERIKSTRIKKRVYFKCFQCGQTTERVRSGYSRSGKRFCTYTCYKNYLKENRVETIDITDSALYKEWRKKVYTRDNFRCKMPGCNSNSRDIAAHHIYPKKLFPEKQFLLNNGITLCKNCHEKTYGKESNFIDALVRVVQTMND